MDIQIKNKKTYTGEGFYIGRPSPLGNPFKVSKNQDRKSAIKFYSAWLKQQIKSNNIIVIKALDDLFNYLINNRKLILVCWCYPKSCHGEIIKEVLLNKYYYGSYIIKEN